VTPELPRALEPVDEEAFSRDRFLMRARALFYARLALLALGLGILVVPAWKAAFGIETAGPVVVYLVMVAYSAVNYVFLERPKVGSALTFVTLSLDLFVLVFLVVSSGGLQSPLLPTQLLFTMLFVMLYPRPFAVIPPLLTFPVVAKIQEIANGGHFDSNDLFFLIWYSAINCIVIYVVVYLNWREELKHREILRLQGSLKELAVVEERTRLAREIHDGLGGTLSSLILQAEYIQNLARDEQMKSEIGELKAQAEESIEELRRSLKMMRDDFELVRAVEEVCGKFEGRTRGLQVRFVRDGRERPVSSEAALTLFRVLQESLANVARHAKATKATVTLHFRDDGCELEVADDGQGFDATRPPPPGHYGLLNMNERAQRSGGRARVESVPGQGTRVSLTVPLAGSTIPPRPHVAAA
jgi:two-component system sensor histidine kinase DegS